MEEGSGNHPKAARVKAAEKEEDPALSAVEAKVQGRTTQSTLTTQVSMEQARKERKVERKVSREKMHSKAKEKASNRIHFSNPMLQPPKSLHQLSRILAPKKPGVRMKQIGHGTRMDTTQTSTIPKKSGRQMKPLGFAADGQTDRPQDEEHHSSEPRPGQMNQSADFRYPGYNAEEMTGEEHVSHQYHLNPAGSSTDYRHSGCSEAIDRRFCSSFVNFDDGFHHALLSKYIDLRYSPTYVIIDSGCTRAMGSRTAIMRLVKACT